MNEIKQKKCKVCSVLFTPYKSTQVVCTPKCAIELAFSKPVKTNILRLEKKVKLQKLKTYTQRVNEVKTIFQRWIRMRDKDSPCISCGIKETKLWDGGHYKKAELYRGVIFHEFNVNRQCRKCNNYLNGNESNYRQGLVNRIGEQKVKDLELLAQETRVYKWTDLELEFLKIKYKTNGKTGNN
jgi:hypothetical protein